MRGPFVVGPRCIAPVAPAIGTALRPGKDSSKAGFIFKIQSKIKKILI